MTQDEIIGMLQESTIEKSTAFDGQFWTLSTKEIEAFAKLVAAKEREECIAIAESKRHAPNFQLTSMPPQNGTAVDIANAIRARGEA